MIRRALAWLAFQLWRALDPEHRLATRLLPKMRTFALPPTPDELLDDSLAGRSEPLEDWLAGPFEPTAMADDDCRECGAPENCGSPGSHHASHCSGYVRPTLMCAIAKGSEFTLEPIPWRAAEWALGKGRSGFVRRYTAPYHVLVDGRLACESSWEPEPNIPTHSVLQIQETRLCRAPACRALWQPERDRARASDRNSA